MFTGMDDADWSAMRHAYSTAEDVPGWIRGLVDPDPAAREIALDAMYGCVHPQGELYDSTIAAVPFLVEALVTPGLPGRGAIAELLASIGGAARTARVGAEIAAAGPVLFALVADPDPAVRAAMPMLLTLYRADLSRVAAVLIGRLPVETDGEVRRALLSGLGRVAVLAGGPTAADITARLLDLAVTPQAISPGPPLGISPGPPSEITPGTPLEISTGAPSEITPGTPSGISPGAPLEISPGAPLEITPGTPLGISPGTPTASTAVAALVAVGAIDPGLLPVAIDPELLERAYAEEPAGLARGLHSDRRAPHAARLINELTGALDDRVADRREILGALLRSRHTDVLTDALDSTGELIERWRGDYRELVLQVAGLLSHADARIAGQAGRHLAGWGPLAAPAAGLLAARIDPDSGLRAFGHLNSAVRALAHLGDERALPALLAAVGRPDRPADIGYQLARFPQHADRIVAAIEPILPAVPPGGRAPEGYSGLLVALRSCGAAAAPAVPKILANPLDSFAATALGRIGPAAGLAIPALRAAADGESPWLAVAAAGALWRIEASPVALRVLTARLEGPASADAMAEIGRMGPAAAAAAPYVATFLDTPDPSWRRPLQAAIAWWRLTGEAGPALPVLTAAWTGRPDARLTIAECLAEMGPAAAALATDLSAEEAEVRRSPAQVGVDEKLRAAIRAALKSMALGGGGR